MDQTTAKLLALAFMLIIDLTWITTQKPMYASLVRAVQNRQMTVYTPAAIVSYAFLVLSFLFLVAPHVHVSKPTAHAFLQGAVVGLVVYGVFNATNAAMFDNYRFLPAVVDTLWGTFILGSTAAFYVALLRA